MTDFKFEGPLERNSDDEYPKDQSKFRIYPFESFTFFRLVARGDTEHYKKGKVVAMGIANEEGDAFVPFYKDKGLSLEIQSLGISAGKDENSKKGGRG